MKLLFLQRVLLSEQMDRVPNEKSAARNSTERSANAFILFAKPGSQQISDNRDCTQ